MWPVGGEQPKVNAGSPTFPLDVSAAWSSDHKFLTVAIVNATESAQGLALNFKGVSLTGKGRMWQMTGPDLNAVDALGKKPAVDIADFPVNAPGNLTFPPASIQILELEAK
jgi:alpha-N-arabinofuranosidase